MIVIHLGPLLICRGIFTNRLKFAELFAFAKKLHNTRIIDSSESGQTLWHHWHSGVKLIVVTTEEETDRRQRLSLLFWGRLQFTTRMNWIKGRIAERTLGRMDDSEKWIFIWFTPHQTTTVPKWMFFQNLFFKSLAADWPYFPAIF